LCDIYETLFYHPAGPKKGMAGEANGPMDPMAMWPWDGDVGCHRMSIFCACTAFFE
jgi:hypothetical protein